MLEFCFSRVVFETLTVLAFLLLSACFCFYFQTVTAITIREKNIRTNADKSRESNLSLTAFQKTK